MVGMVLRKILDQYVSSYQRRFKSVIRLGNNEVLETLRKTLTFVDADANVNSDYEGSTTDLRERYSGELMIKEHTLHNSATSTTIKTVLRPCDELNLT